jgi:pilus assembly protein CpaE
MNSPARALVVFDDRIDRGAVESLVTSDPRVSVDEFVDLVGHRPDHDGAGDVVIVACAEYTAEIGDYVTAATRQHPRRPLIVLCSVPPNGHLSDVIAAGAEDILTLPTAMDPDGTRSLSEQLVFAVHKALVRRRGAQAGATARLAPMIGVLGLKGGSGKTMTASNLGVALAGAGASVAIVDVDLQFGDVGLALGMRPERTLYDLVRAGGSLDAEKLADFLTVHQSGARALLAPARPDEAGVVTAGFLKEVYALLREMHDFVIVDTPPSFTPEVIGAVDDSSHVCLVAMLDSLSLKNSKLGLETLERMGYAGSVRVVLNRADSSVGIAPADVCAIIGRAPDVLVPSDRMITRAVNQGQPIVALQRRSQAARAYQELARLYLAEKLGPGADRGPRRERFRLVRRGR